MIDQGQASLMPVPPIDQSEVSPSVLRDLHAEDLRQARVRMLSRSALAIAALLVWYAIDRQLGSAMLAMTGILVLQAGVAVQLWRGVRRSDPLAPRPESDEAAADARRDIERAHAERMAATLPVATFGLAAVVVIISLLAWTVAGPIERAIAIAGLVKPAVSAGEWWRLLSSTFLHANLLHLSMNVAALVALGRLLEAYASRSMVLVTYLIAGIAGSLASWWLMPQTSSLGASGAIMGLAGFLVAFGWRRRGELPSGLWQSSLTVIALTGYIGALGFRSIDNAAHAGGAVAGALIGLSVPLTAPSRRRTGAVILAGAGAVAAVVLFAGAARTAWTLTHFTGNWVTLLTNARTTVPVTKATIAVTDSVNASIHNASSRSLEAYEFVVYSRGSAIKHIWRDDCCFPMTGSHPIAAGESVDVPLELPPALPFKDALSGTFLIVVFDDGSFEGSRGEFDRVRARRREVLGEADFWIQSIQQVVPRPRAVAVADMTKELNARRFHSTSSAEAAAVFGIEKLVQIGRLTPDRFLDAAVNVRAGLLASRAMLAARLSSAAR